MIRLGTSLLDSKQIKKSKNNEHARKSHCNYIARTSKTFALILAETRAYPCHARALNRNAGNRKQKGRKHRIVVFVAGS